MRIIITPEAERHYLKLPKIEQKKVKKKISQLETNQTAGKKLVGKFSELYSLRAWPYRIIYYINPSHNSIYIITIAHRQGVYS